MTPHCLGTLALCLGVQSKLLERHLFWRRQSPKEKKSKRRQRPKAEVEHSNEKQPTGTSRRVRRRREGEISSRWCVAYCPPPRRTPSSNPTTPCPPRPPRPSLPSPSTSSPPAQTPNGKQPKWMSHRMQTRGRLWPLVGWYATPTPGRGNQNQDN